MVNLANTQIELLRGLNSAEPRYSTGVDGVVAPESVATENAVGLSTLSSMLVDQDRDIVKEDPRLNDCGLDMEVESTLKTPIKRRKSRNDKVSKQVKISDAVEEEIIASDDDDSDSDFSVSVCSEFSACSQNEAVNVLYKAEDISAFLQETKGIKGVQIEDYFPNCAQFVKDTRYLIKEGAFRRSRSVPFMEICKQVKKKNS